MKANELMIGDWVNLSENDKDIIPCKVVELHTDELLVIQPQDTVCDIIGYDMIRPIPLTAKILEKNGFRIGHHGTYNIWGFHIGNHYDGYFMPYIDVGYTTRDLTYVHELQRALRCCGLWDLAENFKI